MFSTRVLHSATPAPRPWPCLLLVVALCVALCGKSSNGMMVSTATPDVPGGNSSNHTANGPAPIVIFVNETVLLSNWPFAEDDEPLLVVVGPSPDSSGSVQCTIDTVCRYSVQLDRPPPTALEAQVDVSFLHDSASTATAELFFVVEDELLPASRKHLQTGTQTPHRTLLSLTRVSALL